MQFGICRIGRAVGLEYSALRKQVDKAKEMQLNATATFVEVPTGLLLSAASAPEAMSGPRLDLPDAHRSGSRGKGHRPWPGWLRFRSGSARPAGAGLDRMGHGKSPRQSQTGVRQKRLDPLTDGPSLQSLFILIAKHFISTNTGTTQNEGRLSPLRELAPRLYPQRASRERMAQ